MTSSGSYPEVNPGWVSGTTELPVVSTLEANHKPTSNSPIQTQEFEADAPLTSQEAQMSEDELQVLKRLGYSYQVLASSIVRAKQAQQDLRAKLNTYKTMIEERQQALQTILTELAEHQANPAIMPANEAELVEEFAQLKEQLKGSHHESLLKKLNHMQIAVETDRHNLPELLKAMRSELDLVILQASRLSALENLNEAYKKYRQFQEYNLRADQEFQSLVKAFAQS